MIIIASTELKNKDKIEFTMNKGNFHKIDNLIYIEVCYGEYNVGEYGKDLDEDIDTDKFYYMTSMGAYFPLSDLESARDYYTLLRDYFTKCDENEAFAKNSESYREMREKARCFGNTIEEIKTLNEKFLKINK